MDEKQRANPDAEAELQAVKERLHHVVSSSPAVLYTLRVEEGRLLSDWVSANISDIVGYAPEEIQGDAWWESRLHPEDRDRMLAQVAELLETGHVEREYRFRARDGSYRWIRDVQRLLLDAAGNPVEVVGSWWDVTDRKLAELRLGESEKQYRLLFDSNPQPMFVYDAESLAFLAANQAAVHQYGWSREELLAMTAADIHPSQDVPSFLALVRHRARDASSESRGRHRRKDGTIVEVEVASNPILFQGREARLVLASDITGRTRLETQLAQAQKMEAVGRLAGGVAHDFNNLLGVITGYAELLLKDLDAAHPGVRRAEQIRKAAERAAALTHQLLAFSRKQVLEPRILDLNGVVADVVRMLLRLIGEDVQIVTVLGEDLGRVRADPGQIEQVLLNLAVNARDAMPGGGELTLETANVDLDAGYCRIYTEVDPGPYVRLEVSDTGHGIDAQTMTHIFEPFFTTKGAGKGTGLGLATVFGIVKQSGGHVEVYSEVGRGSSFRVYLPRVAAAVAAPAAAAAPPGPPPTGSEGVLLVEDAEALGLMVREVLEDAGYEVIHALVPEEAVAAAAAGSRPIHVLLTDVVMPRMSGPAVAERVLAARPGIKVLYMSGYTDEALGHHGTLEPGTHFLQKPFTADALLRKLREVLDADRGAST